MGIAERPYDEREESVQQIADMFGLPRSTPYGRLDQDKTVPRQPGKPFGHPLAGVRYERPETCGHYPVGVPEVVSLPVSFPRSDRVQPPSGGSLHCRSERV